jgi:transcriptional regulator with XRE-family HTH domain
MNFGTIRHPSAAKIRFYRILGENIRKQREALGISETELAKRIGVSLSAMNKWEHGLSSVPAFDLARLEHALGCNLYDLVPTEFEDAEDEAAA